MNRLLALITRTLVDRHQAGDCKAWPHCRICLPAPVATPPIEVRKATVDVLRRHGVDPLARRCVCGLDSAAYFDHVVERLTDAGVLRTEGHPS